MRTLEEATDPADRKAIEDIARHGWHIVMVPEDEEDPGFAFTIGLFATFQHPELIIFGLPLDTLMDLLNYLGEEVRSGARFTVGDSLSVFEGEAECRFAPVATEQYPEYLGTACWYYEGTDFPALQVVWPDRQGCFPAEEGCEEFVRRAQPLLDSE